MFFGFFEAFSLKSSQQTFSVLKLKSFCTLFYSCFMQSLIFFKTYLIAIYILVCHLYAIFCVYYILHYFRVWLYRVLSGRGGRFSLDGHARRPGTMIWMLMVHFRKVFKLVLSCQEDIP